MTKLHEETLTELWESLDKEYRYGVEPELVKLSGYVSELCVGSSTKEEMTFEMRIEGTIEPIFKKEEEVMEDRLYKFSEVIQMLEEGELPEGTKVTGKGYNKSLIVYEGMEGSSIEWQNGLFLHLQSGHINNLFKIEKPSPKRYKALHKVFTDYSVKPFRLFQRTDGSITLLESSAGTGYKHSFTMEELKAFPINLNDFNLEEVLTTV